MTDNVVNLDNLTRLDLPPDRVLEAAKGKIKDGVIIIGYDLDGEEYFASSIADGPEVLWLLERCKQKLLNVSEDDIP